MTAAIAEAPRAALPSEEASPSVNIDPLAASVQPVLTPILNALPFVPVPSARTVPCVVVVGDITRLDWIYYHLQPRIEALTNCYSPFVLNQGSDAYLAEAMLVQNVLRALKISQERNILFGVSEVSEGGRGWDDIWRLLPHDRLRLSAVDTHVIGGPPYAAPLEPDRRAYNGIFAQLLAEGSGAIIHSFLKHRSLMDNIGNMLLALVLERGILPHTLYMHSTHLSQLREERYIDTSAASWLTMPLDDLDDYVVRDLCTLNVERYLRGARPSLLRMLPEELTVQVHAHWAFPEGHILAVPDKQLPWYFYDSDGVLFFPDAPSPMTFATSTGYQQKNWTQDERHYTDVRVHGALRVHTPGLFGWLRGVPTQ